MVGRFISVIYTPFFMDNKSCWYDILIEAYQKHQNKTKIRKEEASQKDASRQNESN